jgi:FixJ family two-component response regulator
MPQGHQKQRPAATERTRRGNDGAAAREPTRPSHVDDACHRLRQPLQSLVLLQALLARTVKGDAAAKLVARMDAALSVMAGIVHELAESPLPTQVAVDSATINSVHRTPTPRKYGKNADTSVVPRLPSTTEKLRGTTMFVVDDDAGIRDAIAGVLEDEGYLVQQFESCESYLKHGYEGADGCLLVDAYLPGMSGLELLRHIQLVGHTLPAIMMTGNSDVPMAVQAMKAGAVDFMEKPIGRDDLLACIARAVEHSRDHHQLVSWQLEAATQISGLTARQREIMDMVLAGHPSKNIAADLGISQRTVENHRASIMKRTGAKSLPELARLAVAAAAVSAPVAQQSTLSTVTSPEPAPSAA